MTSEALKEFLLKSGAPLSYVGKQTGINRTELSYYLHQHRDLTYEKSQKLKRFIEEYAGRWRD